MCRHYGSEPQTWDSPFADWCELEHHPTQGLKGHCYVCEELPLNEDGEKEPVVHGCDESCPDFDPPIEPDWDSMKGGADWVD